ncbi:hypothetical protein CJ030_MR5G003582 [Morella rubra]|uniref:SANTA domain-containing protein n=1 Tax=Morella rubra TaxID=262757 RepID=A0A6A1VNK8_9ROSI|nr:hypothetical protein CJ030_MR5G003582 [Morella rubra]
MAKRGRNSGSTTPLNSKPSPEIESDQKSSKPTTRTPSSTTIVSSALFKSVSLHHWWLARAPHGKGLAIGGFASLERLGVRVFCSAAISKRHDATTLETTDGITITICGFINRSRTHQNGFPPKILTARCQKVCNHFLIGFPYNWEEYAVGCSGEESADRGGVSASDDTNIPLGDIADKSVPFSIEDVPLTRIRDLFMTTFGDPENCQIIKSIYNNISGTSTVNSPMKNVESGINETRINEKESKPDQKYNNNNSVLNPRHMSTVENQKSSCRSERVVNVLTPTRGVSTRSMTRLKNSRMEQEERPLSSANTDFNRLPGHAPETVPGHAPEVTYPTNLVQTVPYPTNLVHTVPGHAPEMIYPTNVVQTVPGHVPEVTYPTNLVQTVPGPPEVTHPTKLVEEDKQVFVNSHKPLVRRSSRRPGVTYPTNLVQTVPGNAPEVTCPTNLVQTVPYPTNLGQTVPGNAPEVTYPTNLVQTVPYPTNLVQTVPGHAEVRSYALLILINHWSEDQAGG